MKKSIFALLMVLLLVATSTLSFAGVNKGFQQGIIIELDGESYTLAGELFYIVKGIIATRNEENDNKYKAMGYVHIHELVTVADGTEHPTKVLYLKHTARTSFNLDLGPAPQFAHEVTPGIDYDFVNNY